MPLSNTTQQRYQPPFRGSFFDRRTMIRDLTQVHWPLVFCISLLLITGLLALYSTNSDHTSFMIAQLQRMVLAIGMMVIVAFMPMRWIAKAALPGYVVMVLLLLAVELWGVRSGGAQRWLSFGALSVQPSEFARILITVTLAWFFSRCLLGHPGLRFRLWHIVCGCFLLFIPVTLIFLQPDLGTALILIAQGIVILFVAGISWWFFVTLAGCLLISVPVAWLWLLHDYQKARIMTFLGTKPDEFSTGYHIAQSKIALGSGGLWGKGFLHGTQSNLNFLPEKHTDFIFVVFAEQFGMLGSLTLIAFYVMLLVVMVMIAAESRSMFGRVLGFGCAGVIAIPTWVNLAMVSSLIPVVGTPLPFVSFGGSSLITCSAAVGLCLNIFRYRHFSDDQLLGKPEN